MAKFDKQAVNYRPGEPDGQRCQNCENFQQPDACQTVTGLISPDDLCDVWQPVQDVVSDFLFGGIKNAAP